MISDSEIFTTIYKNKSKGFELLFDRYYKPLVLFAYNILGETEPAEDIVQDLMLKLWKKEYYRKVEEKALSSYLFGSVRNACFNKLEKQDVLRNKEDIEVLDIIAQEIAKLDEKLVDRIKKEINNLPERTQSVITLVFLNKLRYKEVAEELDVSVNTVKTLLRKGLEHLRTVFDGKDAFILFLIMSKK